MEVNLLRTVVPFIRYTSKDRNTRMCVRPLHTTFILNDGLAVGRVCTCSLINHKRSNDTSTQYNIIRGFGNMSRH